MSNAERGDQAGELSTTVRMDGMPRGRRRHWPAAARLDEQRAGLVRAYLPMVGAHIRRRVKCQRDGSRRDFADLFQEGSLGLIQAALRFDPAAGIPFPVFARPRIRRAVNRALDVMDNMRSRTVDEPVHRALERPTRRMSFAEEELERDLMRGADLEARLEQTLRRAERMLDEQGDNRDAQTDGDFNFDWSDETERELNRIMERRLRERIVEGMLRAEGGDGRCLRDIVRETGVTYSRVRRCVRQLQVATRQLLAADPEVPLRLRNWARCSAENRRVTAEDRHDPVDSAPKISPRERLALQRQSKRQRQRRYRLRLKTRVGDVGGTAEKAGKMRSDPC